MLKALGQGLYILAVIGLTVVSQVGGAVLLLSTLAVWSIFPSSRLRRFKALSVHVFVFALIYGACSLLLVPSLAKISGRVALPCFASEDVPYGALTPLTCALNRNYLVPGAANALKRMTQDVTAVHAGTVVSYLDAGFPFLDGFPMLPHLSHRSGHDLDLAFFYTDAAGTYLPGKARSPIGYWGFEQPPADAKPPCADAGGGLTLRWDVGWLQPLLGPYRLDEARTAEMLGWLVRNGGSHGVKGLIIEPYLAERFGVHSQLIRFQGCKAARHDDHIHVDFKLDP